MVEVNAQSFWSDPATVEAVNILDKYRALRDFLDEKAFQEMQKIYYPKTPGDRRAAAQSLASLREVQDKVTKAMVRILETQTSPLIILDPNR